MHFESRIWTAAVLVFAAWGVCPGIARGADQNEQPDLAAAANEHQAKSPLEIAAYWQNDSQPLHPNNNDDRHYTNGLGLKVAGQPQWADGLAGWMPFGREFERKHGGTDTGAGFLGGQLMFTPRDLEEEDLIEDDRPYAGYLFGGLFWQRTDPDRTTLDHFQLDLGVVGPASQADDVQQGIHDFVDTVRPRGWDNQLGNEVTGQFYFRKKWRLRPFQPADSPGLAWELIPQAGVAVGTVYRNVSAELTGRIGWNMPDDFGPDRLQDVGAATGRGRPGFGVYGFGRIGGRVVEHDMFLEGNNFRDSHGVDPEPLVGEAQVGAEARYQGESWGLSVMYGQTWLTHEFKGQRSGDAFASLTVALNFLF